MKNIGLIIILLLVSFYAQAQIEKGSFQIGIGGLPIIYLDQSEEMGYAIRANVGYSPINKLSVGLMPFAGQVEDMKSIGASIYLRYYILNNKFSLFVEGSGGYGNLKYEYTPEYNGTMNSYNIGPGINYTLINKNNNRLAIELLVQYARLQNINYPENTLVSNTVIPTIGIQYFINK